MKPFLILLFSVLSFLSIAQVTDDFNDGDFTNNPAWAGNVADWTVVGGQLRSNSNVATYGFYLSTPSAFATNAQWEIYMNLQFQTSGVNYVDVYLMSDSANLKSTTNSGYFVRVGTTQDDISLYKRVVGTNTEIIDGLDVQTNSSNNTIRIKVTRDAGNLWTLQRDITGGTTYFTEGTVTDATITSSSFFGIFVQQSVTSFHLKHFFDDVYAGSIILDTAPPEISSVNVISSTQIDVLFNEAVEQSSGEIITNYSVNNGIGNPLTATRDASNLNLVHLTFSTAFSSGSTNTLTVNNVSDLSGNPIINGTGNFSYFDISPAAANDVVINEILFDPFTGGVDFLEIYNRSDKSIDLKDLRIGSFDTIANKLTDIKTITSTTRLLLPGEYLVLTEDPAIVKSQYIIKDQQAFLDIPDLPTMNSDDDIVTIADKDSVIIDKVSYKATMHFSILGETKGVSLERVNFNRPSDDETNWHSAAEDAGFATPGYKNSQFSETINNDGEVTIEPEIFSPDNDGEKDVVNINYKLDMPGFVANISIYDARGRLIRRLVRNELLGTSGTFSWDGIDEDRQKARIGIYIIYFEAFNTDGKVKKFKKSCVLAGDLR